MNFLTNTTRKGSAEDKLKILQNKINILLAQGVPQTPVYMSVEEEEEITRTFLDKFNKKLKIGEFNQQAITENGPQAENPRTFEMDEETTTVTNDVKKDNGKLGKRSKQL